MISRIQWQSPQMFGITAIVLAGVVPAIVWLYRPQVKPVESPWWWVLLGLRTLALGILSLSILRPAILTPVIGRDRPMIAVLIDQSRSMSVVDTGRTPAELIQIAAGLGILPDRSRPKTLVELHRRIDDLRSLIEQVARARSELEYARLSGRGIEPANAHLRETQAALTSAARPLAAEAPPPLRELILGITPDSSEEQLSRIIERTDAMQASADEDLFRTNEFVRTACTELSLQPRIALVQRALEGDSGLYAQLNADRIVRVFGYSRTLSPLQIPAEDLNAEGPASDLAGALRLLQHQLAGQPVGAIVVFSDGRQAGVASDASGPSSDAPVIAVDVAAPVVKDLSLQHVNVPPSAFVGETVTVRVEIASVGLTGTIAQVVVEGDGRRETRAVSLLSDLVRTELPFRVEHPGPQELTISVTPVPGEITIANNRVTRVVKVISDRVRVALIGGVATRDFQQLRDALRSAPGMLVFDQMVDADHPPRLSTEQIAEEDVLILSDVPLSAMEPQQWEAVSRLMDEHGGSVVVIAGDPSTAGSYVSHPLASALLPWRGDAQPAWHVWPGEEPLFRIMPASQDVLDALKLSSDADISRLRWNQLPPVFRYVALPQLKPGARAMLVERDSASPVLTEMRIGAGRSLFLGLNEIWRWRSALGEQDEDRVWLQIIRYAAQDPYAVSDGVLSLDADQLRIDPETPLHVRGRIASEELHGAGVPTLEIRRDGILVRTELLVPASGTTDRYEAVLADLASGEYLLRLTSGYHDLSLPVRVAESNEAEMRDVSGDPDALRRIAGPHGQLISLGQVSSLPQRIAEMRNSEPQFSEMRLWDSPYLFLFVLGCMGCEWAVRKKVGLA